MYQDDAKNKKTEYIYEVTCKYELGIVNINLKCI